MALETQQNLVVNSRHETNYSHAQMPGARVKRSDDRLQSWTQYIKSNPLRVEPACFSKRWRYYIIVYENKDKAKGET